MTCERMPRILRALASGVYPSFSTAAMTLSDVLAEIERLPESAYETVLTDTPASRATSLMPAIVIASFGFPAFSTSSFASFSAAMRCIDVSRHRRNPSISLIESFRRNVSIIIPPHRKYVKRFDTLKAAPSCDYKTTICEQQASPRQRRPQNVDLEAVAVE